MPEEFSGSDANPPPPADRESVRSLSSSRRPSAPHPEDSKERRRSRPSVLHMSASQPELSSHSNGIFKRRGRRHQHSFMSQLASLKHWFVESAKRARSPHPRTPKIGAGPSLKLRLEKSSPDKNQEANKKQEQATSPGLMDLPTPTTVKRSSNASSLTPSGASYAHHRNSYTRTNRGSQRNSLSPAPHTPRSSYRRSSAGLRGRKSTSSSVSSIRSIHHARTHSKASSASTNSLETVSTPAASTRMSRSPHSSVKMLPATPTANTRFPSNIRLVRNGNGGGIGGQQQLPGEGSSIYSAFNESAPVMGSPASGFVFARRKRTVFKGPMLHTAHLTGSTGPGTPTFPADLEEGGKLGRVKPATRKSQIIMEEGDEEDIEEVDNFSNPDETGDLDLKTPTAGPEAAGTHPQVLGPPAEIRPGGLSQARDSVSLAPDELPPTEGPALDPSVPDAPVRAGSPTAAQA